MSQGPAPAGLPQKLDESAILAAIVASTSDAIIAKRLDGEILSWNPGAERLFGYTAEEMIGKSIRRLIPDDRQAEEDEIIARIMRGENVDWFETVRRRKDGSTVEISISVSPVRDASGAVFGASKIARDITERNESHRRIELLVRELHHRSRNLLAIIQSIANLTAAKSPGEFIPRFMERLQAMARNHALLVRTNYESADVAEIIATLMEPFRDLLGSRIRFEGPKVRLNAKATQYFGLALHELMTNSVMFGALSGADGEIDMQWRTDDGAFSFDWRETSAPGRPIGKPGFGATVLNDIVGTTVNGESVFDVKSGAVNWSLRWPEGAIA